MFRAACSFLIWAMLVYLAYHYETCTYLARQAAGQLRILAEAKHPDPAIQLSARAQRNLDLLPALKKYTVDSLGFDETGNYEKVYYHGTQPVIWVVTASKPFSLEPVEWTFPVVGQVSYKGYFDKRLAALELTLLQRQGLDAEISPVSAYSTLGWFSDPVFSSMLERTKPSFCNLIFHELFHATYYVSGNVNLNENLASFIAHKATLQFLRTDTAALALYLRTRSDQQVIRRFMRRKTGELKFLYEHNQDSPDLLHLKTKAIQAIADSAAKLPLFNLKRGKARKNAILSSRNAYFVGYLQYESLQDSLEFAFNKFYRRNIKNMVHDLKRR